MQVTAAQTFAILGQLAHWQHLARADSPGYEALLGLNWRAAAQEVGLRGMPRNCRNGLIQHSRLFEASFPSGEACLAFFLKDGFGEGDLFLAPPCGRREAVFRLEMPAVFKAYPHCTDPLTDESLTLIRAHFLDDRRRIQNGAFVRTCDVWRPQDRVWERDRVLAYLRDPGLLAAWGGLTVTQAFDASDFRCAPSDWVRFVLRDGEGLEGALAACRLGMTWLMAEEDVSDPRVRPILSYSSLMGTVPL